jgi:hypothetical protein
MLYSIVWGKGRPCAGPFLLRTLFLLLRGSFARERGGGFVVGFLARQLLF